MSKETICWCCPYYKWDGKGTVHCEGGKLKLPPAAAEDYIRTYCADNPGWRRCTVARAVTRFYEQLEEAEAGA